jgi:hypothetical protein
LASPSVFPAALAAPAVDAQAEAAAGARLAADVAVAADAPAAAAAAPAVVADCVSALSPGAAAGAVAAFAACVDRQPFAGPHADGLVPAAARHAGAPGLAACACFAVLVDVAARVADSRSVADSRAEPREAGHCSLADWAARQAAVY